LAAVAIFAFLRLRLVFRAVVVLALVVSEIGLKQDNFNFAVLEVSLDFRSVIVGLKDPCH